MTRRLALFLVASALGLGAAQPPSGFALVQPGLWEIQGVPGVAGVARQCVTDVAILARFEHRANNCSAHTVRDGSTSTEVDYSCGPAGFGHSEISVITPRALRIATQGISGGLPFNYVLQARRISDCPSASRH